MDIQALKDEFKPGSIKVDPGEIKPLFEPYTKTIGDKNTYEYLLKLEKNSKKTACIDYMIYQPELTQKEIAEQLGVTEKTICEWKAEEYFSLIVSRGLAREWGKHKNNVLGMLYQKSVKGDLKASELFLRTVG